MMEVNHLDTSQYNISCKNVVQLELDATVHFYFVVNSVESDQVTEVGYFRFCSLQSYNSGNSQADVVTKINSHSSAKRWHIVASDI